MALVAELYDLVIDTIGLQLLGGTEDPLQVLDSLAACSLVCRAWLPRASAWLLQRVLVTRGGDPTKRRLVQFLAIANESARVRRHVTLLTVSDYCSISDVERLLAFFPYLEELFLDIGTPLPDLVEPLGRPLLQSTFVLRGTLQIGACSPATIARVLSLFSEIQHLHIQHPESAGQEPEDDDMHLPQMQCLHVGHLVLKDMEYQTWYVLRRYLIPQSLHSANFIGERGRYFRVSHIFDFFGLFIYLSCKNIRALSFNLDFLYDIENSTVILEEQKTAMTYDVFSTLANLEDLTVGLPGKHPAQARGTLDFLALAKVVSAVRLTLRTLSIHFDPIVLPEACGVSGELAPLVAAIADAPALQQVSVVLVPGMIPSRYHSDMQRHHPSVNADCCALDTLTDNLYWVNPGEDHGIRHLETIHGYKGWLRNTLEKLRAVLLGRNERMLGYSVKVDGATLW